MDCARLLIRLSDERRYLRNFSERTTQKQASCGHLQFKSHHSKRKKAKMEDTRKSRREGKKEGKEKGADGSENGQKEVQQEEDLYEDGLVFGGVMIRRYFVPRDEEDSHYVKSFSPSGKDDEAILKFFETYGFVVVRDVLSALECQNTVASVFDLLEAGVSMSLLIPSRISSHLQQNNRFDRNDISTWSAWPSDGMEKVCVSTQLKIHA